MEIVHDVKIHNRFDIYKNDEFVGYAENLVLDQAWTRIVAGSSYFNYIHFGTGSGVLAANRTGLFVHLGTKAPVDVESIKALPVSRWKRKITLNPEEFVGSTLTEVGIAFGSSANQLCTHAMIKDAEGNQISITKSATDVINIFATVFFTLVAPEGVELIGMPTSNWLINHLIGQTGFAQADLCIGGADVVGASALTRTVDATTVISNMTAVNDIPNKKRSYSKRVSISEANRQIKELAVQNLFRAKFPIPNIFLKQNYVGVSLGIGDGVKKSFKIPSDNILLNELNVKLNGVLSSDYVTKLVNSKLNFVHDYFDTPVQSDYVNNGFMAITPDKEWVIYSFYRRYAAIPFYIYKKSGEIYTLFRTTAENSGSYNESPCLVKATNTKIIFVTTGNVFTFLLINGDWVLKTKSISYCYSAGATSDLSKIIFGNAGGAPWSYFLEWDDVTSNYIQVTNPPQIGTNSYYGNVISDDKNVIVAACTGPNFLSCKVFNGTIWENATFDVQPSTQAEALALSSDGLKLICADEAGLNIRFYERLGLNWSLTSSLILERNADGRIFANETFDTFVVALKDSPNAGLVYLENDVLSFKGYLSQIVFPLAVVQMISKQACIGTTGRYNSKSVILGNLENKETEIVFNSAPAAGVAITTDYAMAGIHKTDQYVIDVSFAIQFGEGV